MIRGHDAVAAHPRRSDGRRPADPARSGASRSSNQCLVRSCARAGCRWEIELRRWRHGSANMRRRRPAARQHDHHHMLAPLVSRARRSRTTPSGAATRPQRAGAGRSGRSGSGLWGGQLGGRRRAGERAGPGQSGSRVRAGRAPRGARAGDTVGGLYTRLSPSDRLRLWRGCSHCAALCRSAHSAQYG